MRQFPLLLDGKVHNFDTDGRVLDTSDNVIGTWNTADGNVIRVSKSQGGSTDLAVDWLFNEFNQLTIGLDGNVLFTIVNIVDGLPRFSLDRNVLVVDPDGDGDFKFRLTCLFGMQQDGNLVVSINGKESILDGFIEDSKSRFRFQFFDKSLKNFQNSLLFSGKWEPKTGAPSDRILLHFKPDTPVEIPGKPLDLPAVVKVDPQRNHFALVFESKSHGVHTLQFLGSMEIKPGWKLQFRIADSKDGGTRESTIDVETDFAFDRGQGSLMLKVGKTQSATAQTIEIGGAVKANLGSNGALTWTFDYRKSTSGQTALTTLATSLRYEFRNGEIFAVFKKDGQKQELAVTGKVVTDNFALAGGVEIKNDPQGRSVKAFFGVSF